MDSRLVSHSTAGTSGARNALAGHSHVCAIAKPSRSRRNGRCVQLHVSARASAPERLQTNGASALCSNSTIPFCWSCLLISTLTKQPMVNLLGC